MNNYGPSQFGGGGFVSSPAPDAGGNVRDKSKAGQQQQTLRAVTIRQLMKENANRADDEFKVDGIDITTVSLIGRIQSMQEQATCFKLVMSDGTGTIDVSQWSSEENAETLAAKRQLFKVGSYVRVYGHFRAFDGKKCMNAYAIKPITDHNEITYHMIQCVFQHVHLTKGDIPAAGGAMGVGQMGAAYGNQYAAKPNMGGAPTYGAAPTAGGGINDEIMDIMNSAEHASRGNGTHLDEIAQILHARGRHCSAPEIKQAVEFLSNQGNLYSTADDNTYKTTMSN